MSYRAPFPVAAPYFFQQLFYGLVFLLLALFLNSTSAFAQSETKFPNDWKTWPVTATGTISGAETPIPANAPPILRDTLRSYNWINNGKGSAYEVRVNPAQMNTYLAHNGKFIDGPTAILVLTDINVLLVTEHLLGQPSYGVFSVEGKDITGAHPSLAPQVCRTCHTGYSDICINGVCSTKRK